MEETLGKRIALHRKRLSLTQDALAEQLGVTAQAVSKWENDQSCPDITMLPKLAEIFDVTTDELLGREKKTAVVAEVVTGAGESDDTEPNGIHVNNGEWEFKWDGGRKSSVAFAAWVLLVGIILLAMYFDYPTPYVSYTLWELLWTTGLLVFGLAGLYPRFSVFRFGCAFFGGYFLLERGGLLQLDMGMDLILPIVLLLFGVSLLADALRKPRKGGFHLTHNGRSFRRNDCSYEGESFSCETCFGENDFLISLPRLSKGSAEVSFGSMTVDLSACEALAEPCQVHLNCAFGELTVLIPKRYRTEIVSSTAFGSVEEKGMPDPDAEMTIGLSCDVSFGEITIRHI